MFFLIIIIIIVSTIIIIIIIVVVVIILIFIVDNFILKFLKFFYLRNVFIIIKIVICSCHY